MSGIREKNQSGFTIVELLIVTVVIAILAAISIVAYTGVQERARTVQLVNDAATIKKAMELYRADNGEYPRCPTSGTCYFATDIRPQLVPGYVNSLPTYNFSYAYYYTTYSDRWAMRYMSSTSPYNVSMTCKFGANMIESWYSSAPECGA